MLKIPIQNQAKAAGLGQQGFEVVKKQHNNLEGKKREIKRERKRKQQQQDIDASEQHRRRKSAAPVLKHRSSEAALDAGTFGAHGVQTGSRFSGQALLITRPTRQRLLLLD